MKRPMVVAYKLAPMSYWVGRLLRLIKVKYMSLPNLLADAPLVPEFLQRDASPEAMGAAVLDYLDAPDACAELLTRFEEIHDRLRRSAGQRSALEVLDVAGLSVAQSLASDDNVSLGNGGERDTTEGG